MIGCKLELFWYPAPVSSFTCTRKGAGIGFRDLDLRALTSWWLRTQRTSMVYLGGCFRAELRSPVKNKWLADILRFSPSDFSSKCVSYLVLTVEFDCEATLFFRGKKRNFEKIFSFSVVCTHTALRWLWPFSCHACHWFIKDYWRDHFFLGPATLKYWGGVDRKRGGVAWTAWYRPSNEGIM